MDKTLIGHGPSKVSLVARKKFPVSEGLRCSQEFRKMEDLFAISMACRLFKIPEIFDVSDTYYDMEYIEGATELGECGYMYKSSELRDRLLAIVEVLSKARCLTGDVWPVMIEKFKQLKTDDKRYNELVSELPQKMFFPDSCNGYCHGDLTFDNILVAHGDWYLIDPVWSLAESPLWDVGKICQSILIGWKQIKTLGKIDFKDGWITALCYSASGHASDSLLDALISKYSYNGVVLSTACQLARVARWCFPNVLIPIINELLTRFFSNRDGESKIRELPAIIERMLS